MSKREPKPKPIENRTLPHLNGHQLCAIDLETTGLEAGYHEIVQIAIIPINSAYEMSKTLPVFDLHLRPTHLDRVDPLARRKIGGEKFGEIVKTGFSQEAGLELFDSWYNSLGVPYETRIVPLGYNYSGFDQLFLREWLGHVQYNHYFDSRIHEVNAIVNFMNGRADMHIQQMPFAGSQKLAMIAKRLGIEVEGKLHDAMYDAMLTVEIYKKMLWEPLHVTF